MSNLYKESAVSGELKSWNAMRSATADNPYGGSPLLTMFEVRRTSLDGELIREHPTGRQLVIPVQSPGIKIPYINPDTYEQILDANGNPIEGYYFTDESFAQMVACAYIYKAVIADLEEEYVALNTEALDLEAIAAQPGATQEQIDAATAKRAEADAKLARLNQVLAW